jgi:hypothetical protein
MAGAGGALGAFITKGDKSYYSSSKPSAEAQATVARSVASASADGFKKFARRV